MTATPVELIRMLYEGAIQAVEQAVRALHSGDIFGRGRSITKAIEILSELRVSLRQGVQEEYTHTLSQLYGYMQRQLIRAHSDQAEAPMQEVLRLLNTLLEGWSGGMESAKAAAPEANAPAAEDAPQFSALNPYSPEAPEPVLHGRSWHL